MPNTITSAQPPFLAPTPTERPPTPAAAEASPAAIPPRATTEFSDRDRRFSDETLAALVAAQASTANQISQNMRDQLRGITAYMPPVIAL